MEYLGLKFQGINLYRGMAKAYEDSQRDFTPGINNYPKANTFFKKKMNSAHAYTHTYTHDPVQKVGGEIWL